MCSVGVCLSLFLLLNVVDFPIYVKLSLVVGMSDGKEIAVTQPGGPGAPPPRPEKKGKSEKEKKK